MTHSNNIDEHQLDTRQLVILILGLMSTGIGQSIVFTVLPPLGREVGFDEFQTTTIISISAILFAAMSPVWGRLSDRIGRKPTILIGLIAYALGNLLFTSSLAAGLYGYLTGTPLFIAVIAARCSQSSIMAATGPASMSYAAERTSRQKRVRTLAKLGTATSMGMIVGPAIGGMLATFGLLVPMVAASGLALVATFVIWGLLPEAKVTPDPNKPKPPKLKVTDRRLRPFMVAAIGGFTGFAGVQQTLGFRLQDTLNLSSTDTAKYAGICMMVSALSTLTTQLTVSQRFTGSPVILIRAGLLSLTASASLIALDLGYYAILVAMVMLGAGVGLSLPSVAAAASLAVSKEEQGGAAGVITSGPATGFVIGPIGAGALYTISHELSAIVTAAILLVVSTYLFVAVKADSVDPNSPEN